MYQSRIKNGKKRTNRDEKNRGVIEPGEDQEYGIVQEFVGNGRLRTLCTDGKIRLARIRGNMRKSTHKVLIEKGDLILISLRDFEEDKVDIIHKYTHEEANNLINCKNTTVPTIISKAWINSTGSGNVIEDDDDNVVFYQEDTNKIIEDL